MAVPAIGGVGKCVVGAFAANLPRLLHRIIIKPARPCLRGHAVR